MRVLLIQPDYKREAESGEDLASKLLPARSLLELAAVIENDGHEVVVFDPLTALDGDGLDMEAALEKTLDSDRFDVAGVAVYTPTRKEANQLARAVKRRSRLTKVIAGGPHPAPLAESILRAWPEVDYVCLGAADRSLPALVNSIGGKTGPAFRVKNIAFRSGPKTVRLTGKPSYQADLDSRPPIGYQSYLERTPGQSIRRAYVMTARGCSHWCNFCSQLWKKVILADPADVAGEIERLVKDCGAREIILYDDCFGMKSGHARSVLEAVIGTGVEVSLQAVTRFDAIYEDWLDLFVEAGGRDILAGLESGSPRLRKRMNKHVDESKLCRGSELVREMGLRLAVFVMFGFPNETDADVEETWRLLKKMGPAQVMSTVHDIKPGDLLFEFGMAGETLEEAAWLDEDRRSVNYMSEDELMRAAARAIAFDRMFTREVVMPEHDPAGFVLGLDPGRLEGLVEEEMAR